MIILEMYLIINFRMDIEILLMEVEKIVPDIIDKIYLSYLSFKL